MQKDVHFYLTFLLARKACIAVNEAKKIAWANQYTDDLTEAELHGIQTQSGLVDDWGHRQIQLSVLVPFHFIPGDDQHHPWMTTRNNPRARALVEEALAERASGKLFQFGIALHGLQDTFSHEGFSGWKEDLNSCFPWYYIQSAIPNVGHAELRVVPDVVNYVWTDPRNGRRVDNKRRTMSAARATFEFLAEWSNSHIDPAIWKALERKLQDIFKMDSYDRRIDELCVLSGTRDIDYADVNRTYAKKHKSDFIRAAYNHLAEAMKLFEDLLRPNEG